MKDPYYDRSEISNSDLSELKRQLYGGMEIDPVHAKFGNLIDHMITEPEKVDYFKLTCAGEQMTEGDFKKAEEMKKAGHTDLLLMSAGPYKHHSCMSAYCVDAQKMADAVGMDCWKNDSMNRFFSQILFFD